MQHPKSESNLESCIDECLSQMLAVLGTVARDRMYDQSERTVQGSWGADIEMRIKISSANVAIVQNVEELQRWMKMVKM